MAKKKVVELTEEQKLENQKKCEIEKIKERLDRFSNPTYSFCIGDKVRFGSFKETVVEDILFDGKVYGVICASEKKDGINIKEEKSYRAVEWTEVRPLKDGDTNFTRNDDVRLLFVNSDLDALLHTYYGMGIDMNPDYQRGYVWTQEDKELLLDSVFKNIDIGKFVLVHLSDYEYLERGRSYEILDGKQRLSTLIEFYENRFPYKGKYYNDLSYKDKRTFNRLTISVANVHETDKKTVLKYFLMLNRTGRSMDKTHLEKVEQMLNDIT